MSGNLVFLESEINEIGAPGGWKCHHFNVVEVRIVSMVSVRVEKRKLEAPSKALVN